MTKLSAKELADYQQGAEEYPEYMGGCKELLGHIAALEAEMAEVEHDRNRSVNHLYKLAHDFDDLRAELAACKAERDRYREALERIFVTGGDRVVKIKEICGEALAAYDALKKP